MKDQLKLFEVVFFTKDDANPELDDSNISFIARAYSPIEAAKIVEDAWLNIPNHYIPFAVAAIEFGVDPFNNVPKVISEAIKDDALSYDKNEDNYIYWRRDEANEPWMNVNELHKGNIVYFEPE
jgi:hypothetical protein